MFDVQQAFDDYSRDNHVDPTCFSFNLLDRCAHGSRCRNRHKVTLKDKALKWFRHNSSTMKDFLESSDGRALIRSNPLRSEFK